jgi:N-acetylglucosamine kinase-like BadF-type ATPase
MTRYVVAADGGNSKTDLVLATTGGRVLARVRGPGTNAHRDGVEAMAGDLATLTDRARIQAGVPSAAEVEVGVFHLASLDLPGEERAAVRALQRQKVAGDIVAANDAFAVLHAGSTTGWGVAVVSGAGVNAVGLHPNGRVARFLAIGELSGDWGGGLGVGVAALGAAVRAGDGRGEPTALRRRIAQRLGFKSPEDVAIAVYQGRLPRYALLDLAPVTVAAAEDGDDVARAIITRLTDEVGVMVLTLLRRLRLLRAGAEIVLGGGVLQSGSPLIFQGIAARVHEHAPGARLETLDVPPVAGSLDEALARTGATTAARARAKQALRAPTAQAP